MSGLQQTASGYSLGTISGALDSFGIATGTTTTTWVSDATNTFVVNVAPAHPIPAPPDPDAPEVAWLKRRIQEVCWRG